MAQKRMLNKSISLSSQVNKLSLKHKLIFTWCIPHLDDHGLLDSDPEVIKATVVPMVKDINLADIRSFIAVCVNGKLIEEYQDCIFFAGFENHQSISEEKRSKSKFSRIPKIPQENSGKNNISQNSPVQDKRIEDKRIEEKIREPFDFSLFWEIYPKKTTKKEAKEKWDQLSPETQKAILDDIPKRAADDKWINGYHKDPIRYLRHEQWKDDIIPPRAVSNRAGHSHDNFNEK